MVRLDRLPWRIATVSRGFVLIAVGGPILWTRDTAALFALVLIGAIWTTTTILDLRQRLPLQILTTSEALLVGTVCGIAANSSLAVLGTLGVAPFWASLFRGLWGMTVALAAELAALVAFALLTIGQLTAELGYATFTWSVTALGLGLIGSFLHSALAERHDPLESYHYARGLLRQLIDISDGLDSGLDPVALGGSILSAVRDEVPTTAVAVYVPRGDALTPLVTRSLGSPDDLGSCDTLAAQVWATGEPELHGRVFALPLAADTGTVGVVTGTLPEGTRRLGVEEQVYRLTDELRPSAVHLDTALLFAAFRDAASAEERRRLAREMHDGVAQDIASLGYLADALAAVATTESQRERIGQLRERVTAIVAEIRRSLVNLRTNIGESESLGAAIAAVARNLSEVSGVAIHVTADEQTERLRPEVEAELFRIAQEAMNNAVKHARATTIDVHCQVRAPAARITVTDDGRGLQPGRSDSHGLEIMRERALLINAALSLSDAPGGGLRVSVTIPGAGVVPAEVTIGSSQLGDGRSNESKVGV
ncbi:sensor histidine kinase [Nocardioides sp.]|uniref:sensor histidine kinase n=1 Tax=Nocardioides sp. TaxID=35761 RepID=UPI0039E65E64